jgi:hypothetical protein
MIATLLLGSFLGWIVYVYGSGWLFMASRAFRISEAPPPGLPLTLLAGLVFVAWLAQVMNLFMPLGGGFLLFLLLGAVWISVRRRVGVQLTLPHGGLLRFFLFLACLTILENINHLSTNPDTGLYHAQTIRWFETFRIVPGLGNIQERYAFNSVWLVLNAGLSLAFLGIQSFRLVNGLTFFAAMLFFASGLRDLRTKGLQLSSILKILFLILSFYLLGSEISSVGNDMPITLLIWVVLTLWVERFESAQENSQSEILLVVLPIFALTVKLSSLPVLLFPLSLLISYIRRRDGLRAGTFLGLGVVLVVPWLVRSVILSGYLVFPFSQIDLFPVDWKVPAVVAEAARQSIVGFARFGDDWRSAIGLPVTQWAPIWFEDVTLNRKLILWFTAGSPLVLFAGWLLNRVAVTRPYRFAWAVMYIGSVFWFLSAPDIRFGYGFLIGASGLALAPAMQWLGQFDPSRWVTALVLLIGLILFQAFTLWRSVETEAYPQAFLLQADYRPSSAEPCAIQGAVLYCRRPDAQCQYELFPCIPYPRPEVQLRGPTFQSGFRSPLEP